MAIAKWYKVDFHTHTPESNCFPDKSVTPDMWLKAAKESGMNAVIVTDHNSVGYIDKIEKIKSAYEENNNFKVFYGIEICVSAEFTHFLLVFDDKMTVVDIQDAVISHLGLQRRDWANTEINVSEDKLKNICDNLGDRLFVIPAHFASNKGLGKCNINAIKKYNEFINFAAIEVRNNEDIREYENKVREKAINKAVLVSGSDNPSTLDEHQHSIDGFGKKYTWVKMSSLSFEGLRQVFIDPEHRCINWVELQEFDLDYNPNEATHNYISGIKFEGISHMTDMDMRFSPNLNCIIGGRGTGKSTIVDAINYGVGHEKDLSKCELLNKTMKNDGKITTYFEFGSNNSYVIEINRKKKLLECQVSDEQGVVVNPPEFKIDFYGQKEIFSLIEEDDSIAHLDKSPLIKMIDEKVSSEMFSYSDDINDAILAMIKLSDEYKINRKKINEMPTIKAEIEKTEAILKKYKASGIEKAREDYETVDSRIRQVEKVIDDEVNQLSVSISQYEEFNQWLSNQIENTKKNSENDNNVEMNVINSIIEANVEIIVLLNKNREAMGKIKESYRATKAYSQREEMYDKYMKALEQVRNTHGENIDFLQEQLQNNRIRYSELLTLQTTQRELEGKIEKSISDFIAIRLKLTQKRKEIIANLELDTIQIDITAMGHMARWKANLQREFGKEDIFDAIFQILADYVLQSDNDFLNYKKYLQFLLTSDSGDIESIGITLSDTRFNRLWQDKVKNDTLGSLIKVIPEDKIRIRIVDNSGMIDINEGSPGQKSAAMLAFILNSGQNPLIIDQPEDDLDNSLIHKLIVQSIRRMKNHRQIIIVTHNPNIPVLGDAEGIIILERNSEGKVTFRKGKKAGCVEEKVIREGICEIMEGGTVAFKKRAEKYLYQ